MGGNSMPGNNGFYSLPNSDMTSSIPNTEPEEAEQTVWTDAEKNAMAPVKRVLAQKYMPPRKIPRFGTAKNQNVSSRNPSNRTGSELKKGESQNLMKKFNGLNNNNKFKKKEVKPFVPKIYISQSK